KEEWRFEAEEAMAQAVKDLVRGVRQIRTDMDVPPSRKAKIFITSDKEEKRETFRQMADAYRTLAGASEIIVAEDASGVDDSAVSVVIPDVVAYIPLEELVDLEKERERLNKEKQRLEKELARSKGMLSNERFLAKAPAEKVEEERRKQKEYEQMMNDVLKRLEQFE
ncbi:MAG: valine--tRNA ligase, partial [Lachnospiraceae bacterium]|nr:valine--tRNA ligase [Lachnospiraceae bacterium]